MTTYNTGNPVGSPAVKDLFDNAENFDEALNGSSSTWTDRRGTTRKAWASIENNIEAVEENANDQIAAVTQNANSQMSLVTQNANQSIDQTTNNANAIIAGLGYQVPVPYEAGIDLSLANQTVSYDGNVYAPVGSALPFTTSGSFETAKFRLIQGVSSADLAQSFGAGLIGYDDDTVQAVLDEAKPMQSYTALRNYTGRAKGVRITMPGVAGIFQLDDADTTTPDDGGAVIVDGAGRRWKRIITGALTPHMFGKVPGASSDASAAINAAINSANIIGAEVFCPPDSYKLDNPIALVSGVRVYGVRSKSILLQYGQYAISAPENLDTATFEGFTFDFRGASASRYYEAIHLLAHTRCTFQNFSFIRYDDQTIITRKPSAAATINTVDNKYADWQISACAHVDIAIGLEGYYYTAAGDGTTAEFNTGVVWPERFNSSVVVVAEDENRTFNEMDLTTDYTVTYDGSGVLTVTLSAALAENHVLHVWPSQPRTDGNRRPISNNEWARIYVDYIFVAGHTHARWVDAERWSKGRYLLAANNTDIFITNPYKNRNGQGGDFALYNDLVVSYRSGASLVTDPSTLTAFNWGPGSTNMTTRDVIGDLVWRHNGTSRLIDYRDRSRVQLDGTVSTTAGSPTVTGSGTAFRDVLTLIGNPPDIVEIGGKGYGIASIDSDTQITLSSNASATLSGADIYRIQYGNKVSGQGSFLGTGDGQTYTNSKTVGEWVIGSNTIQGGSATITSGQSSVTVSFQLSRAPRPGEIYVIPYSDLGGRSLQISNLTYSSASRAGSFDIKTNTGADADYEFGWEIRLRELN